MFFLILFSIALAPWRFARAFVASFGWAPAQILTEWPLEDVKFSSATTGWTVGSNGLIFKTTDGGKSWTQKTSNTTAVLYALDFSGANVWAVGIGTTLKSTDSGETWVATPSADRFYGVDFVSTTVGFRVGEVTGSNAGLIQKTVDSGTTWTSQTLPANTKTIFDIHCTDANNCVAVGRDGLILRTINGGTLWKSKSSGTIAIFQDAHFPVASTGFAVGETGLVRKSDNAGDSWFNPVSGGGNAATKDLNGVFFTSVTSGWAVGADGTIVQTSDGGATWTALTLDTIKSRTLRAVYFTDATHGWIVGLNGTLVRYGDMLAPTAPTNMARTSGSQDTTPTFSWNAGTDNVGVTAYEVEILKSGTAIIPRVNIGNLLTYTVPDSQALSGGQHNFQVYALDAFGNRSTKGALIFTLTFPPNPPANLAQRDIVGGADQNAGFTDDDDTIVLVGTLTDPDAGDTMKLELEIRAKGTAFTNTATSASDWVQNGATVQYAVSGLTNSLSYHWQARTLQSGGENVASSWVAFGGNSEDIADFTISIPSAPPPSPPDTGGGTSGGGTTGGGTTGGGTTGGGTPSTPSTPPTPSTPSISGPPFSLSQMQADAERIVQADLAGLLISLGLNAETQCQMPRATALTKVSALYGTIVNAAIRDALVNFMSCGTVSTLHLGAGERLGTVNSYKSAFGRLPETSAHWFDVLKIANGRFPGETSTAAEVDAKVRFKKIYARNPNMDQQNDKAAVTVMAYGLRPLPRNLNSEKAAIIIFKKIFAYAPTSAIDWDAVRAIAYSGAKR